MELYGAQLSPLLETLIRYGIPAGINPGGSFHSRAMWRASLGRWLTENGVSGSADTAESQGNGD
jgi:hypothetical protein